MTTMAGTCGGAAGMTLVLFDDAAGLLSEDSPEGATARALAGELVLDGPEAGIGIWVTAETAGRIRGFALRRRLEACAPAGDVPDARIMAAARAARAGHGWLMVLVVPDEAAELLRGSTAQGKLAQDLAERAAQYGRGARLGLSVSVKAALACPPFLRGMLPPGSVPWPGSSVAGGRTAW